MDISVRQRLARFRREFLTLDWGGRGRGRSRDRATEQDAVTDHILDDALSAYATIRHRSSVAWQQRDAVGDIHTSELDDSAAAWSAAPEVAAAIGNLSQSIAAEGASLAELAARARRESRDITEAQVRAASRALERINSGDDEQDASHAAPAHQEEPDPQAWLDLFAPLRDLTGAIAETALETGLCAVRAGSATRGFAQFAREIDELERALRAGWNEIERLVTELEECGAQAGAMAAELRMTRRAVDATVSEFANDTISPHAAAPLVRHRLGRLGPLAAQAGSAARHLADDAQHMAELVETLVEQLTVIVRETPVGDRRSARRLAFHAPCTLATATRSYPARTIDVSLNGALVSVGDARPFLPGQPIRLTLAEVPPVMGSIAGISGQGIHITFDLGHSVNREAGGALRRMLRALQRHDETLVARASGLAREIRTVLERGVAEGSIRQDAMHAQDYEPIPGAEPPRYYHPAGAFLAEQIAPFVGGTADRAPDIGYAAIIDRSGFVAILAERRDPHEHVEPGREGERLNAGMIRQDPQGRRHARNLRPYLAHNLRARGTILRVVSAPIFIGGRHWGCAEVAFRLPDAPDVSKDEEIGVLFEQDQGADITSG